MVCLQSPWRLLVQPLSWQGHRCWIRGELEVSSPGVAAKPEGLAQSSLGGGSCLCPLAFPCWYVWERPRSHGSGCQWGLGEALGGTQPLTRRLRSHSVLQLALSGLFPGLVSHVCVHACVCVGASLVDMSPLAFQLSLSQLVTSPQTPVRCHSAKAVPQSPEGSQPQAVSAPVLPRASPHTWVSTPPDCWQALEF